MCNLLVCQWIEAFHRFQERASIVATACIDFAAQYGHAQSASFAQHWNCVLPGALFDVKVLNAVEYGESVMSAKRVDATIKFNNA